MLKKIFITLALAVFLVSCGSQTNSQNASENSSSSVISNSFATPEDLFYSLIADRRSGSLNGEILWNKYVSDKSKTLDIFNEMDFIKESNSNTSTDTMKGYSLDNVQIYENSNYAKISYKITTSSIFGAESINSYEDYLIKENGQWKLLLLGVYETTDYPREVEKDKLSISSLSVRKTISGIVVYFSVSNRTDKTYNLGWSSAPEIRLETDSNTFSMFLKEPIKLTAGADYNTSVFFSSANGKIKNIQVRDIYELDTAGTAPVDANKKISIKRNLE